jgi:hypothetical protein
MSVMAKARVNGLAIGRTLQICHARVMLATDGRPRRGTVNRCGPGHERKECLA